jgi:hypothetical protein
LGFVQCLRTYWTLSLSEGIPRRSLIVGIVVGTLLNLINQGDVLLADARLDVWKLILTYIIPYCVATYGAVAARVAQQRDG